MPFFDTIYIPDGTRIYLWELVESAATLTQHCSFLRIALPDGSCHEKRLREKLAERLLLHHIFGKEVTLKHTPDGAPWLDTPWHISISHSENWVAIAVNDNHRIGIDIEQHRPRVIRVRERFLNAEELAFTPADDLAANVAAWTAKEALYKLFAGMGGASFSDDYAAGMETSTVGNLTMRSATAKCEPANSLTLFSATLPTAIISIAVETKYINSII